MKEGPPTLKGLKSGQTQGLGHLRLSPSPAAPAPRAGLCCPVPGGWTFFQRNRSSFSNSQQNCHNSVPAARKWGPSSSSLKVPRSKYTCPVSLPDPGHAPGHWPTGNKTARGDFLDERLLAPLGRGVLQLQTSKRNRFTCRGLSDVELEDKSWGGRVTLPAQITVWMALCNCHVPWSFITSLHTFHSLNVHLPLPAPLMEGLFWLLELIPKDQGMNADEQ
ncbi:uncharacterized protein LOC102749744 [Leptonychotes weddellii]|uniref:Uncharacterized protein LOC102749744 n=1 Tax=Leptonychotes weddellii TaxID=9713 RepID=A0A7F8QUP3_LEPWE|nr:uncharacterized protein LOC102749744 [Leptonychotes weddellii]